MKLNSTQVDQTLSQVNAHVLPDNHPTMMQLTDPSLTSLVPHEPESTGTIVVFRDARH